MENINLQYNTLGIPFQCVSSITSLTRFSEFSQKSPFARKSLEICICCYYKNFFEFLHFLNFQSDQDMLCRISKYFCCKQFETCQKKICSEKYRHLYTNVQNHPKSSFMSNIMCISVYFAIVLEILIFEFQSDLEMLCRISKKKFLVRKISAQENPGICIQIFKSSEMIIYCRISYNCQCICHYIDHFQVFEF